MKFDCGLTAAEKAAKLRREAHERANKLMQWHDYFAWWPIRMGSRDCRWLETVERRAVYWNFSLVTTEYPEFWHWEYRSK